MEKEKNHLAGVDVASAFSDPKSLKASDYFSKVRYIPLETTDESPFDPSNILSLNVLKGVEEGYKWFGSPNLKGLIDLQFKEPEQGYIQ